MSQQVTGKSNVRTFLAGDTLTANAVVTFMTSGTQGHFCRPWQTATQAILGVTNGPASATGESVEVVLDGTMKVLANTSISAGAFVGPATDAAGRILEIGQAATTTANRPHLGIALESVSNTSSLVEVLLQPYSRRAPSA